MVMEENNKLIAEFMGLSEIKEGWTTDHNKPVTSLNEIIHAEMEDETWYVNWLKFYESWDWLMPVVEKIEKLGVSTDIHYFAGTKKQSFGYFYSVNFLGYSSNLSTYDDSNQHESKIEAVYSTVIKFIKWYNENKKQNDLNTR